MLKKRLESWRRWRVWLSSPLGQSLIEVEGQKVQPLINRVFGYHALLLGEPSFLQLLHQSPTLHRIWVQPEEILPVEAGEAAMESSAIQGRPDKLPILSDEIDLLCLAHCLENMPNPHEILRESYRALKPEGHLLIVGFNPWSVWGLWRLLLRYIKPLPWDGQFISRTRLRDWLALLGFDLIKMDMCFFRPPINHETALRRTRGLEWLGRWLWPFWGASYIILAQKRVLTLTALKPAWAERKRVLPGRLVEPVTRL